MCVFGVASNTSSLTQLTGYSQHLFVHCICRRVRDRGTVGATRSIYFHLLSLPYRVSNMHNMNARYHGAAPLFMNLSSPFVTT